jgi:uncharacterized damage-inducible protein DinB
MLKELSSMAIPDTPDTNPDPTKQPHGEPPEPWLRGTLTDVPAVARAVLHSLQLAREDVERWCGALTTEQLQKRPFGLAAVAFHLRHASRSLDRLLTYAEGHELNLQQATELRSEMQPSATRKELFEEFENALTKSALRVRAFGGADLEQTRFVGKLGLPSTVGGLLVHVAEHTQRHVGQAVTTAKIVTAE